jgi:hypothetical protein
MRVKLFIVICLIIFIAAGCAPNPDPDLSAWIEQPEDGAQLPQLPINLHIVGQARLGIDEFDLYINGQLEDSFPPQQTGSTSGGPTKFFSEYLWSPPGTGTFVLGVRAHGGSGGTSPLSEITIEIQPPFAQGSNPPEIGVQSGPSIVLTPGYNPGEGLIGTPTFPSFVINSADLYTCDDQDYIMVEVWNNGPYYFQWADMHVWYAGGPHNLDNWEGPWVFFGSECPVPSSGSPSFAPGASAYIYFPITLVFPYDEFQIGLTMCTYSSYPNNDQCPHQSIELQEDIWHIAILKEMALCYVGPGPYYEIVNSIPEGTSVELLGKGEVEGYLVVQEPKYRRPCWLQTENTEDIPEETFDVLTIFEIPLLPEGVVNGRVFKDQDGDGEFGGLDVGLAGARVTLAPGTCGNPGQAIPTTTDSNGWYSFSNVDPGPYCIYVPKPTTCQQFSTADSYDLSVDWGSVNEKNFGLTACR